ncbi:PREDICTED: lysosomal Pro-X carboxypeptidase-like [Branchiostoma belcheri]|uniref:Lysosomal Pro-X carboxypeptidase n=1 Tax=Branchiostoma belcheri TaxID=7741 RepID=A0A6P4ZWX4_BRABE|nr:PREDICTED: lysosomal Pro-X carboxypeptidase-like [Branchiostoma belcheri]
MSHVAACLVCLSVVLTGGTGLLTPRFPRPKGPVLRSEYSYDTKYFTQPVDHFSFATSDTFDQRYLINRKYFEGDGGPIFFYTGNEGDITWFGDNTGFMWDIAPKFKAMVVFAEHRYYGDSMPYGKDSYKDPRHLGYLTAEQALADFARLITHLKSSIPGAADSPVVAFGGSYGGMLAAWFRMKYPSSVIGSLAASAPVWQFEGLTPCGSQYSIITQDFQKGSPGCDTRIRKSWDLLNQIGQTAAGREKLSSMFSLCSPLNTTKDVTVTMTQWLLNTWFNLAMVDYPYPASFLEPLPAWPIKEVCSLITKSLDVLEGIAAGATLYYNYTGQATCLNIQESAVSSLGDLGWSFQFCSEMTMPSCSDGVHDMFFPEPWNLTAYMAQCKSAWKVTPRPYWILQQFGGKNITAASNIIFSNGLLDPWSAGGVTESLSDSLVAITIADGAHHLDLRSSNPADPQSVIEAREQEVEIIREWLQQYYSGL